MTLKTKKGDNTIRIKVTTTLRRDLYEALQIECIKRRCNANDILEELIAEHLSRQRRKAVSDGMHRNIAAHG